VEFLDVCRKFIAVESTPSTGNVEVAKLAGELCKEIGLHVEYQEGVIAGVAQMNVIARPAPSRPPEEIMFQTHLDTAEPGIYSLWTETDRNPFNASIRDGSIYGLGAAHKLDFICKLWAIKELGKQKWKTPFVLVGTFGEESGMLGAKKLMQSKSVNVKNAIVGEASSMKLVTACNGIAVLDFFIPFDDTEKSYRLQHSEAESTSTNSRIFRGKAAHAATPGLGENAITKAIRYLEELPDTIAILTIDGGTFHNIVPDQAYVEVDISRALINGAGRKMLSLIKELENLSTDFIRFSDLKVQPPTPTLNYGVVRTYEDGLQLIVSLRMTPSVRDQDLQGWRTRIREFCQKPGIRFRLRDFKLPWKIEDDKPLVKSAQMILNGLQLPMDTASKSTNNESSVFYQEGIECIVFGSGDAGTDHGPNESNKVLDLQKSVEFYKKLIERLCL
jgi:acetylornithine deacetylase/succinyl-diaminopimelate desuccinylase-like protein